MTQQYHYANGKRKTSVARVYVQPNGSGEVVINGVPAAQYFTVSTQLGTILEPLQAVEQDKLVNIMVKVFGGGTTGQAQAIRHGIARGLVKMDIKFRPVLKRMGFLTRDARTVERKKPGLRKARRAPQWAKR
ncbi:MAG: 30S ribosomal protein S9 [bacterium]|nr:30S ribosomal protein S9 [bacterium]